MCDKFVGKRDNRNGERSWENFCGQKFSQTFQKTLIMGHAVNGVSHKTLIEKQPLRVTHPVRTERMLDYSAVGNANCLVPQLDGLD